jgi:hypothetical protein
VSWPGGLIRGENDEGFDDVCHFLGLLFRNIERIPGAFEELIAGAGGTREELASLVVLYIDRVLPRPDSTVTTQALLHLVGIVYLVANAS